MKDSILLRRLKKGIVFWLYELSQEIFLHHFVCVYYRAFHAHPNFKRTAAKNVTTFMLGEQKWLPR